MGKKMSRFTAILLCAVIYLTSMASAADAEINPTIRVGLFYGSSSLPGANLENHTGSGYRLGYFDENLDFVQLGTTAETQISIVKTQNVSLSGGNYVDGSGGGVSVGCFHLELPESYATFEDATMAASGIQGGFPAWIDGQYFVRAGTYTTREAAQADQAALGLTAAAVSGTSSYATTVVVTKTGRPVFQLDGGGSRSLGIMPGLDTTTQAVTWCKGYRYYGGFQYLRQGGGNLSVINVVPLEDYVRGVLPYEMSNDWPLEALKAQAVCARTYAYMNLNRHTADGFDVCTTTECQVYKGAGLANGTTDRAVEETYGKYVWYGNQLAETFYFSSDGGATSDVTSIWNANVNMPYLKGVVDPYEASVSSQISQYTWTKSLSKASIATTLQSKGYGCASIVDVSISELSDSGNPVTVTFLDSNGKKWSFGPEKVRIWFGFRSNRFGVEGGGTGASFYVNEKGDTLSSIAGAYAVDGSGNVLQVPGTPYVITGTGTEQPTGASSASSGSSVTFSGSGWGHNVGMSQWGANAMARQGMTYDSILTFYFTGVTIR